jgi:hypothetical protein
MRTTYTIDSIKFVENFLVIKVEGKEYFFELKRISEKLNAASEKDIFLKFHLQDMEFIGLY